MILSRRDPELIRTLFELEVPEIADGLVEIRGVAREPGYRSKIAVESHAQGVDPVGACVGPRGSRVRMVVSELRGEKIDIIPWNPEPARFVAKALSPARVREVYLDDDAQEATVVMPDDQLALAIGKEGMNARLAARLTGWKVDIKSDTEFAQRGGRGRLRRRRRRGDTSSPAAAPRCSRAASAARTRPCRARATAACPRTRSWRTAPRCGRTRAGRGRVRAGARGRGRARRAGGREHRPRQRRGARGGRRPRGPAEAETRRRGGVRACCVTQSRSGRARAAAARLRRRELLRFVALDGALTHSPRGHRGAASTRAGAWPASSGRGNGTPSAARCERPCGSIRSCAALHLSANG